MMGHLANNGVWRLTVLLAAAAVLAGCAQTAAPGSTAALGMAAPTPRPSQSIASAKIDALLGEGFGRSLTTADMEAAYQAQLQALEVSRPGTAVTWSNPATGNRGEIVPGPTYIVNALECRDFVHTVTDPDGVETGRGTACRTADGTWQSIV